MSRCVFKLLKEPLFERFEEHRVASPQSRGEGFARLR